jgi:hypothetical protein
MKDNWYNAAATALLTTCYWLIMLAAGWFWKPKGRGK